MEKKIRKIYYLEKIIKMYIYIHIYLCIYRHTQREREVIYKYICLHTIVWPPAIISGRPSVTLRLSQKRKERSHPPSLSQVTPVSLLCAGPSFSSIHILWDSLLSGVPTMRKNCDKHALPVSIPLSCPSLSRNRVGGL